MGYIWNQLCLLSKLSMNFTSFGNRSYRTLLHFYAAFLMNDSFLKVEILFEHKTKTAVMCRNWKLII